MYLYISLGSCWRAVYMIAALFMIPAAISSAHHTEPSSATVMPYAPVGFCVATKDGGSKNLNSLVAVLSMPTCAFCSLMYLAETAELFCKL